MNKQEKIEYTKDKLNEGWSQRKIARELNVDSSTVRYWIKQNFKISSHVSSVEHLQDNIKQNKHHYAYILGAYLGDGCISTHPRSYALRIFTDNDYPEIIQREIDSLQKIFPNNKVNSWKQKYADCTEIKVYNKHHPILFAQHGEANKHTRDVSLHDWQWDIVKEEPECFLIGLIDSDGCEYYHTQVVGGKERSYKMFMFTNMSPDIVNMYSETLKLLNIEHTFVRYKTGKVNVYVRKRSDVTKLEEIYKLAINKLKY